MGTFDISPEPTPSWSTSLEEWGLSWKFHIYIFGVVFLIVSVFNLFSLIYHVKERKTKSKRTFRCYISINALLLFFNLPRGILLLMDPYNSNVNDLLISQGVAFLFWGSTVPCFTSAFMLITLALLDITKVQLYSNRFESMKLISVIIVANFTLVLSFDFTVVLRPDLNWLLYICQAFFLLLGFVIAFVMLYTGTKVLRELRHSARQVHLFDFQMQNEARQPAEEPQTMGTGQSSNRNVTVPKHEISTETGTVGSIGKAVKSKCVGKQINCSRNVNWKSRAFRRGTFRLTVITIVTSIAAICYSLVQVYSFIAVYHVNDSTRAIHPWHWFIYQTLARFLETTMSISISYIVRLQDIIHFCKGLCGS